MKYHNPKITYALNHANILFPGSAAQASAAETVAEGELEGLLEITPGSLAGLLTITPAP